MAFNYFVDCMSAKQRSGKDFRFFLLEPYKNDTETDTLE